eukprot:9499966-Pyramimonas_sp.AAC.1
MSALKPAAGEAIAPIIAENGLTEEEKKAADLAELRDMAGQYGDEIMQFLAQNNPQKPAKMHVAYLSFMQGAWDGLSAAVESCEKLDKNGQ